MPHGGVDLEQGRLSSAGSEGSSDDYSQFYDGHSFAYVSGSRRASSVSDCSVQRDCRICHLGLESNSHESGTPIELGCSCKDDLAAAHKHCAEVWFKIKGNKTCEICHSLARNVAGATEVETVELPSNDNNNSITVFASVPLSETQSFWQGHRFLNFLLACMVFAFVISWLFHFNKQSD